MKSDYPLFESVVQERHPIRPLKAVSDFVVEQLPQRLIAIREGTDNVDELISTCEMLLVNSFSYTPSKQFGLDRELDQRLMLLDLLFLDSAIVHSGGVSGGRLTSLIEQLSQEADRIPALTYEDLVYAHTNPLLVDPRTFTNGVNGLSERDFYVGHMRVEEELQACVTMCHSVLKNQISQSHFDSVLRQVAQRVEVVKEYMEMLGTKMTPEHFRVFRQYLDTHPVRGFKGPSGVFSATFPALEILVAGDKLPQEYYDYYEKNLQYLPRHEWPLLEEARQLAFEGRTLGNLAVQNLSLYELVKAINTSIQRFRGTHYRGVERQIPEVLNGEATGTGGEQDVDAFLKGRMRIRH
jgi:tryptophan 2,3-dioxygenase